MSLRADPGRSGTAFVLGGGGSLGAVQVGMMRALLEHGIRADLVVGSSVGAINAAYFAGNPTLEGLSELEAIWLRLKRSDILCLGWRGLFGLLGRRDHLFSSDRFSRLLETHLPYRNLEDAVLPLHVVATDALTGEALVLSHGPVTLALLASTAIPAAFAPVGFDGKLLVDGALASNTPVRAAVTCGARRLIVLPTTCVRLERNRPSGALASAVHAITLLMARQLAGKIAGLGGAAECRVVPADFTVGVSSFDFSRTPELIERGYQTTKQWIDRGGIGGVTRLAPSDRQRERAIRRAWQRELPRPRSARRNRAARDRSVLLLRMRAAPLAPVTVKCSKPPKLEVYPAISEPV
jgi:NTE family protein